MHLQVPLANAEVRNSLVGVAVSANTTGASPAAALGRTHLVMYYSTQKCHMLF